jgi:hypothetical protein
MTNCKHIHTSIYAADGSRMCHDCGNEVEPPGTYPVRSDGNNLKYATALPTGGGLYWVDGVGFVCVMEE